MDQVALAMRNINQASAQSVWNENAAHALHKLGVTLKQLAEQYRV